MCAILFWRANLPNNFNGFRNGSRIFVLQFGKRLLCRFSFVLRVALLRRYAFYEYGRIRPYSVSGFCFRQLFGWQQLGSRLFVFGAAVPFSSVLHQRVILFSRFCIFVGQSAALIFGFSRFSGLWFLPRCSVAGLRKLLSRKVSASQKTGAKAHQHTAEQGAAPDRLQLHSFRSCLTPFISLSAAGELVVVLPRATCTKRDRKTANAVIKFVDEIIVVNNYVE